MHRLFVADSNNNRVVVYALDSSNNILSRVASAVLGQPDLNSSVFATTQSGMSYPYGVAYDVANTRLFVADGNSRILVFNAATITNGQNAANVLGQANFTSGAYGTTQSGMSYPYGVAYDAANTRLFVADAQNCRVLAFNVATITNGQNAANVLGQANFTSSLPATTQSRMSNPTAVTYDAANTRLFVADQYNNRVLMFNVATITNGQNAANVLGQANFATGTGATTQSGMSWPYGVAYDAANNRLFEAEFMNSRVLVFNAATISNGQNAANVLGQADFTSNGYSTTQSGMLYPYGVAYDAANTRLFVADNSNNRVLVFNAATISNGQKAADLFGELNDLDQPYYTKGGANNGPNNRGLSQPYDVAVDTVMHRLFVADNANGRVVVYTLDSSNNILSRVATNVLGQADLSSSASATTQSGMGGPNAVAYDAGNTRLFVADYNNNRVLVYNVETITNGQNAANVLGVANFTTNTGGVTTQSGMGGPNAVAYDAGNTRLFVADTMNNRVLAYSVATITNGQNAANVLGVANFTTNTGGVTTQSGMYVPYGVAYDAGNTRLFVADAGNSRVLAYSVATITNGQNAANVLGVANFTTNTGGVTTQSGMNYATGVAYDAANTRLFVADYYNNRVLVYNVATITNGQNAANVLGVANFTTNTGGVTTQSGMGGPNAVAYDAGNSRLFVADTMNNRVKVYDFAGAPPGNARIIGVYASSFTVAFTSVAASSGYTLDASTNSDYSSNVTSSVTYVTSLSTLTTPSSLSPNTTYYLRLGAFYTGTTIYTYVTTAGTSTLTNLISPSLLSVTSNTVTAGWPAFGLGPGTSTAEGYELDYSTWSNFTTYQSSVTPDVTFSTLTLSSLIPYTTYYLRAGAINWNGVVNYVSMPSTMTLGAAVTSPAITAVSSATITATWTPPSPNNTTGFDVEASTAPAGDFSGTLFSSVTAATGSTSLTVGASPALSPNTTYFVRIGALYSGTTAYSNTVPSSTSTLTAVVTGAQAYAVNYTSVTVNWAGLGANNAEGYLLQASTASNFTGTVLSSRTTDVALSTLTVAGLTVGTAYYLRVGGLNWNGVVNYVSMPSTMTLGAAVTSPAITAVSSATITATWTAPSPNLTTGFDVEASTAPAGDFSGTLFSSVTAATGSTSLTVGASPALSPNTTYFVRIGALYYGATSYANTVPSSTSTLTAVVTGAQVYAVNYTSITVNWAGLGTNNGEGYLLQASTASNFTGTVLSSQTTSVALSTLTVAGLTVGTAYYLRVGGLNWNGAVNFASSVSTVTRRACTRYWVGGGATNTWGDVIGNWSTTSGGPRGGGALTLTDDVCFDANSGVGVSSITASITIRSLDCTGYTGTLEMDGGNTLSIGNATASPDNHALIFPAGGMTYKFSNTGLGIANISFISTNASAQTVNFNGLLVSSTNITFNGAGGSWVLTGTMNTDATATVTLTNGTLNTNGQALTMGAFSSSNSNTRALTLGSSAITLSGANGGPNGIWIILGTGMTLSSGTATITLTDTSGTGKTFNGGGLAYPSLSITGGGTGTVNLTGNNTFYNFTVGYPKTLSLTAGTTQYITGAFTAVGVAGSTITINTTSPTTQATLNKASGHVVADYVSLQNSNAIGGAAWYAGANSTNVSGNSGWIWTADCSTYTSVASSSWSLASTWDAGDVPTACNPVVIATTVTLNAEAYAGALTINAGDDLQTMGFNLAVTTGVVMNGTLDATDTGPGTSGHATVLSVGGNWTQGTSSLFTVYDSSAIFNGAQAQTVNTLGQGFNTLIDSNTSAGGIIFASSWTATNLIATGLTGPTTMYFAGNSTYTITNLMLAGSAGNMVVLRSTSTNTSTYFHIGSTDTVTYVDVQDNNASGGDNILATDGTSANSGNNQNWIFTRLNGNFFLLME